MNDVLDLMYLFVLVFTTGIGLAFAGVFLYVIGVGIVNGIAYLIGYGKWRRGIINE